MSTKTENSSAVSSQPPHMIQAMAGGFNTVAHNIHLILPSVALDLMLWLGPHLRIKELIEKDLSDLIRLLARISPSEMNTDWQTIERATILFLEQYNLAGHLSTFPIGVPSLLAWQAQIGGNAPTHTPFGSAPMVDLPSGGLYVLGLIVFLLCGLFLGTVYFSAIARSCANTLAKPACPDTPGLQSTMRLPAFRLPVLIWQTVQVIAMMFILVIFLLMLAVPALWISLYLSMVNPFLSQFVLLLATFFFIWFIIPLVFSPHGIFLCGQSMFNAILTSARVVRTAMPGTGMFLLSTFVLYQGLSVVWRFAPDTSWMSLVGILGHSFIAAGLLAASFFYYRSGLEYNRSLTNNPFPGRRI